MRLKISPKTRRAVQILNNGGVGVMPTDTIYGIVGSALNRKAVERIYKLRRRNPRKPMIILISDMRQATWDKFGVKPDRTTMRILKKLWPGKVSVILRIGDKRHATRKRLKYLHRGTKTLAFRLPKPAWLRRFLRKTGPLVAPSANWEGHLPAKTIKEAKKYFGNNAVFYINGGKIISGPSKLIKIEHGKVVILRK